MRRISWWLLSTVSVVVLLFGFDASQHQTSTTGQPLASAVSGATAGTSTTAPSNSSTNSSTTSSTTSDGSTKTVTGDTASTQWGPVQVQLTFAGNTITKVVVTEYPNGNPHDGEINSYALPILIKETTAAQSAKIDMVSGATVTSTGYLQSLQSAIDKAEA